MLKADGYGFFRRPMDILSLYCVGVYHLGEMDIYSPLVYYCILLLVSFTISIVA